MPDDTATSSFIYFYFFSFSVSFNIIFHNFRTSFNIFWKNIFVSNFPFLTAGVDSSNLTSTHLMAKIH